MRRRCSTGTATRGAVWVHLQGGLSTLLSHTTHLQGVKVRPLLGGESLHAAIKTDNNQIVCRVLNQLRVLKLFEFQSFKTTVPFILYQRNSRVMQMGELHCTFDVYCFTLAELLGRILLASP
jgi:hypothetical protein